MWTPNQHTRRNNYNWDYSTRKSFHYCQEYGHKPQNYIRTNFNQNCNRWLNQTTCFSCLKTGHVSRNYPTKVKAPKTKVNKGKEKVDVENIREDMKKTWQKIDGASASNGEITSPNRSNDQKMNYFYFY